MKLQIKLYEKFRRFFLVLESINSQLFFLKKTFNGLMRSSVFRI